ncbi:MAG: SRPBCC domain-containing protein [Ferruginibacter sp.]
MATADFSTTLLVEQTVQEVFDAVNNVRGWWSEEVEESTDKMGNEFVYRHLDLHYSRHKITELVPGKKIVWSVTDSTMYFVKKNKDEWTGTKVIFDISTTGNKTQLTVTHHGLTPALECFGACSGGWNHYLHKSLLPLITTGKGQPDKKTS